MRYEIALNERGLRIGQDHQRAVLTDAEVELIRSLREDGLRYPAIARIFEVSVYTIGRICRFERRAQTPARWMTVDEDGKPVIPRARKSYPSKKPKVRRKSMAEWFAAARLAAVPPLWH